MIIKNLFLLALFLFCTAVSAQNTAYKDPGYDTNYIKSFRDYLVVTVVSSAVSNDVSVTDTTNQDVIFATNVPTSFGMAVDYKWLTAEYTSTFGRTGDADKGTTKMQSIGFGLTGRKFWFRNFYQKTQGYYLENPQYFYPEFNPATDAYPYRGDIQATMYWASLNYGFNHRKFSNQAALWQLERQKKSAGSFTSGITFSYASYRADSALIPQKYQRFFEKEEFLTNFEFGILGINFGYLHTFAMGKSRKLFISMALIPGVSYQVGKGYSTETSITKKDGNIGLHAESRLVFGYNADTWYTSLSTSVYAVTTSFEHANPFSQGYGFVRIVFGVKFKLPETKSAFLKKLKL